MSGSGPILQAGLLRTGDPPREDPDASVLALAERAGIGPGDRVLDAGCGVGGPAMVIAAAHDGVTVDGVTVSEEQVAIARRRVAEAGLDGRVRIHLADYERLPFPDASFDQVVFFESTGYARDVEVTYAEAARVLAPGGRLYVKDVFAQSDPTVAGRQALAEFDELWGCVRTKSVEESVAAMEAAGLEVVAAGDLEDVGTSRLVGTMFSLGDAGLAVTELGRSFWRPEIDPPIRFAEISATNPT